MSRNQKLPTQSQKNQPKQVPSSWSDRLQPEDYKELKQTFQIFDEDNSGTIDPSEISTILEQLGLDRRNPFVLNIILALKDASKSLNFNEFVEIVGSRIGETKTRDGLKRVFNIYDSDESGYIDFEKLKHIAHIVGDRMNDDDILEMMHSTFINKKTSSNEVFNFQEFYTIVTGWLAKK